MYIDTVSRGKQAMVAVLTNKMCNVTLCTTCYADVVIGTLRCPVCHGVLESDTPDEPRSLSDRVVSDIRRRTFMRQKQAADAKQTQRLLMSAM